MAKEKKNDMLLFSALYLVEKDRKKRSLWCKEWYKKRDRLSHANLMNELKFYPSDWNNYMRMQENVFLELLNLVAPIIEKKDTVMRESKSAYERLTAKLRFLATGASYEELKYPTAISPSSLSSIIPETCRAKIKALGKDYMTMLSNEDDWKNIAEDFKDKWQFLHCLGAIDGKHIKITPPPGAGSYYYNYKKFNSIVLMACTNANYEIIWCEVGCHDRMSDGGVIKTTEFYEKLIEGSLNLPGANAVNGVDFVFVGDEAFALREDFLKPFSQADLTNARRIYNYRLSRARRIIENVFGIITQRFRIMQSAINLPVEKVDFIVRTICILHNFLRRKATCFHQTPEEEISDEFDATLTPLQMSQLSRNPTHDAKAVREAFVNYFNGAGAVAWQDKYK